MNTLTATADMVRVSRASKIPAVFAQLPNTRYEFRA